MLNDPAKKHYGIALPTAESVMTEQAFSQFALSGGANVFDAQGNIQIDTPEMLNALAFYKELAKNTMPGSNDVMEIKDAFMNGSAPMAVYSTYILPAVFKEGSCQSGLCGSNGKIVCGLRHGDVADDHDRSD